MAKPTDIIARYGNWYKGADDFFTHCLILRSGECRLLGQGLNTVTLTKFKAPAAKLRRLKTLTATIPAGWAAASYAGFNFITDAESASASEIAVHGKKSGGIAGYFVPAAGSEAETLVKAIAKID
jgi:hypothetical protein